VHHFRFETLVGLISVVALFGATSGCSEEGVSGCESDDDCRGDRICSGGFCLDPGVEDTSSPPTTDSGPGPDEGLPPDTGVPDGGPPRDSGGPDADADTSDDAGDSGDIAGDTAPDIVSPDAGMVGPQIRVVPPEELEFGTITVPDSTTEPVVVRNAGDAPLSITAAGLGQTPSQGFSVSGPSTPQNLSPGDSISFDVTFNPNQQAQFQNELVIESNDRDPADRETDVTLSGTAFNKVTQPCLFSTPDSLDYGVVQPGNSKTLEVTVGNCSTMDSVTVTRYNFLSNPGGMFNIDSSTRQPPFRLNTNQSEKLKITYSPTSKRSVEGELSIRSDETTGGGDFVELVGSGGGCPEADAQGRVPTEDHDRLREGPVAAKPGKMVELDGTESSSPSGRVNYNWTIVSQPSGASASLSSNSSARPTFTPGTSGVYEVELSVSNPVTGTPGCVDDTIDVVSLGSDPDLEVTTTWQADHDLNVHVVRSNSNGNFPNFRDPDDDVYAQQQTQDWGTSNVRTDDAFHLGNSTGGSPGSERVLVSNLENNRSYRIAVHFRDSNGFRPARFPLETTIDVQGSEQSLTHQYTIRDRNKFWISYEVDGSTGNVTRVDRER